MWILIGVTAIIFTVINWIQFIKGKDNSLSAVIALSLTAYTFVLQNRMYLAWLQQGDYSALADVLPTMTTAFIILTTISIILNVLPVSIRYRKNKYID